MNRVSPITHASLDSRKPGATAMARQTDKINLAAEFRFNQAAGYGVHSPRGAMNWPALRQTLSGLYQEMKSDLFHFKKDTLIPGASGIINKIDPALKLGTAPEKAEQLLQLNDEAENTFGNIAMAQDNRTARAAYLTTGATILAGLLLGSPVFLLIFLTGFVASLKLAANSTAATRSGTRISDRIDRELLAMAASDETRASLFNSAKFQQKVIDKGVFKKVFTRAGWGHSKDADYEKAVATLTQNEAPAAPVA
jgi:hypothetical protein